MRKEVCKSLSLVLCQMSHTASTPVRPTSITKWAVNIVKALDFIMDALVQKVAPVVGSDVEVEGWRLSGVPGAARSGEGATPVANQALCVFGGEEAWALLGGKRTITHLKASSVAALLIQLLHWWRGFDFVWLISLHWVKSCRCTPGRLFLVIFLFKGDRVHTDWIPLWKVFLVIDLYLT